MKNNSKSKGMLVVLIITIFIALGLIGYILYDKGIITFGTVLEKSSDSDGKIDEENLNINSGFVKNLYMMVESDNRCFNTVTAAEEFDVKASDIDYDTKFVMAMEIMLDSDKSSLECNKYSATKYFDVPSNGVGCGDNYYNTTTNKFENYGGGSTFTTLLSEDKVKDRVEQIFGDGSYERREIIEFAQHWYKYIPEELGYVQLTIPVGGTCMGHSDELVSAVRKGKEIVITEKKDFYSSSVADTNKSSYFYEYTFTLNSKDNSYYLTNIKSSKI